MTTQNPFPAPSVPVRGSLQKTFVPAKILSGFTDQPHFESMTGEYLSTLNPAQKTKVLTDADASRAFVATLPQFQKVSAIRRAISHQYVTSLQSDPIFLQSFAQRPHQFAYVDPTKLIALQAWVEPRQDSVPTTEDELMEFAFPRTWDIPVEISFVQPNGPIQILSSTPTLQGLAIDFDQPNGRIMLGAPKHLNLIQVVHFQGNYFLRNGFHRVVDALAVGCQEVPAIVVEAFIPQEVQLPGNSTFNVGYVLGRQRPPLVSDFHTPASLTTQVRERRYGVIVSLDIKMLNIGI